MKTTPMKHQAEGLVRCDGKRNFAFFMEQGTGKSWLLLADAERCYLEGRIDTLLIIAPKGVHINWCRREIPQHLSCNHKIYCWRGNPASKKRRKELEDFIDGMDKLSKPPLYIFVINIDAINFKGYEWVEKFIDKARCMAAIDESSRIKNHASKRTKKCIKLGRNATARRLLSGTPLTNNPGDLYSQFDFLKHGILGTTSYRSFFSHYAELVTEIDPEYWQIASMLPAGVPMPQVVRRDDFGKPIYKNLDHLRDVVAPHMYRVRKDECLDLPPKIYEPVFFTLTPEQRAAYDQLIEENSFLAQITPDMPLEEIHFPKPGIATKAKQITSGFINVYNEPVLLEPELNERMNMFKEVIESYVYDGRQFIVWAMFKEELRQIKEYLESLEINCAIYAGGVKDTERENIIDDFQAGKLQCFIGQAQAGGIGLTLTASDLTIYYSCSYDWEIRAQSEDRNHRKGTEKPVTYIDLIAEETIDENIMASLDTKKSVAAKVIDGV